MKKVCLILSVAVIATITLTAWIRGDNTQPASDFKEVKIGNQIWMVENLNVDKFRNGDSIPEAKTIKEWKKAAKEQKPVWCYHDNDPANGAKYGKLYNWYALKDPRGLAPEGWHVSSAEEWVQLIEFLGGQSVAGIKMKSTGGWPDNENGTNESGFYGLPGGVRYDNGSHSYTKGYPSNIGNTGYWWTSTQNRSDDAWHRLLQNNTGYVNIGTSYKGSGLAVRCIKD